MESDPGGLALGALDEFHAHFWAASVVLSSTPLPSRQESSMSTATAATPVGEFVRSTIGRKMLVSITGLAMIVFVIGHLLGNLLVFAGPDALNAYGYFMKSKPALLWSARIGLLAVLFVHLWASLTLNLANRDARPQRYYSHKPIQSTLGSRTMVQTGLLLLAFIVFHLLHYTVGVTHPEHFEKTTTLMWQGQEVVCHDVYGMVIAGFSDPLVAGAYIVSMLLLGLHLSHGIASLFQSVGFRHSVYTPFLRKAGLAIAVLLAGGNIAIVIAVLTGLVGRGGNG